MCSWCMNVQDKLVPTDELGTRRQHFQSIDHRVVFVSLFSIIKAIVFVELGSNESNRGRFDCIVSAVMCDEWCSKVGFVLLMSFLNFMCRT